MLPGESRTIGIPTRWSEFGLSSDAVYSVNDFVPAVSFLPSSRFGATYQTLVQLLYTIGPLQSFRTCALRSMATNMKIKCPSCEAVLNIPASAAGKVVKCPCGKQLRAPAAPAGNTAAGSDPGGADPAPTSATSGTASGSTESSLFDDLPSAAPSNAPNPFTQNSPYTPPAASGGGNAAPTQHVAPTAASNQAHPVSIVSLVFGILSLTLGCCCWLHIPLGITAAVTGGFGIHFANQGRGGKGMAISGLIMGIIALVLYTIIAILGIAFNIANMPNGTFNQ